MKTSIKSAALASSLLLATLTTPASPIDTYRWQNRLLIVFADNETSAKLTQQRALIAQEKPQFTDRDLIAIEVIGNTVKGATDSARTLRNRYHAPAGKFHILLIGKDGGIKMQSDHPITPEQLFGTIDAMPMRQQETQHPPKS